MTWVLSMLVIAPLAGAAPYQELREEEVDWEIDPGLVDVWLEEAAGRAPADATSVTVLVQGPDGLVRPAQAHLPVMPEVPEKEPARRGLPLDHPGKADGALSGKAIYMSQCHGWIYYSGVGFDTQRGNWYGGVEDIMNPEGANAFLLPYLENAGASVFAARERDMNPWSVIVDDGDPDYEEDGEGFADGASGFGARSSWSYGVNPFQSGGTRKFPADGGGVARWTPDIPEAGWQAVYVSWDSDPSNARAAHYRITHPGGVIDRYHDQTVHGSTWQYVETLWLPAGKGGLVVELIGDTGEASRTLSVDAVRVGGGMGDVTRVGEKTDRPRWEEGATLYVQYNGAPTSIYDPSGNGNGTDPTVRSKWADWEHPAGEDALYLSWHSNAGESHTARGTVTYFAGGGPDAPAGLGSQCSNPAVSGSYTWASLLQEEIIDSFRTLWEPSWPIAYATSTGGVTTACFAEVNPGYNDEMPAALVELAFHDNETDSSYLRHPRYRQDAARAMYRAAVRYFAERDGTTPHFLPEPPTSVALVHDANGELKLSWKDGPKGGVYGDAADGWVVELSSDGRSWGEGFAVSSRSVVLDDVLAGDTVFARVSATNVGGISFPSEIVGARRSPEGAAPVLVVLGFDRLDRGLLLKEPAWASAGTFDRMDLPHMNPYDAAVSHGLAVSEAGWYFDTTADENIGDLDLSAYALVWWAAGEESSGDVTFTLDQQVVIEDFVDAGGALWVTGSEVLWDLDHLGDSADQAFAAGVLGASMESDEASTMTARGVGLLDGVGSLAFAPEDGAPYLAEYPDVLASNREVLAWYDTAGTERAAVWDGQVVLFGFPFECIGDPSVRTEVAVRLLPALVPDYEPPDPPDDPGPGGDPEDPGTGPDHGRVAFSELGGCGCHAPGLGQGPWWLALTLLYGRRRQRR